jgi:ABC-type multidrug transport system ATPase subunit
MVKLEIRHLTKRYGTHVVLNKLSYVTKYSLLGIAGSNGSGKSTLLRCISGLNKPNSGSVIWSIDGRKWSPDELNGKIGFTAPYIELYEGMSVTENLHFLQNLTRDKHQIDILPIDDLLNRCQAHSFADKPYGDLSTGQRQRVKLAAALIHNPPLLCLDEPGSNLDEQGRSLIESVVRDFAGLNKMVVIATNQSEELKMCDEVIDLDDLKIE